MPSRGVDANSVIEAIANNTSREVKNEEVRAILERMSTAGFRNRERSAKEWQADGYRVVGKKDPSGRRITSTSRLTDHEVHLMKRIQEGQWREGTSLQGYTSDLHTCTESADSSLQLRVGLYVIEQGVTLARAAIVVKIDERGPCVNTNFDVDEPLMFVVYDAKAGALVSGYMIAESEIPRIFAKWRNCRIIP